MGKIRAENKKCRKCIVNNGLIIPINTQTNIHRVRVKGVPITFSREHKNNLSFNKLGKKWITSPDLKTLKQVSPDLLPDYLNNGWIAGYKHHIKG